MHVDTRNDIPKTGSLKNLNIRLFFQDVPEQRVGKRTDWICEI